MESLQRVYGISFPDKKELKEWQRFQVNDISSYIVVQRTVVALIITTLEQLV